MSDARRVDEADKQRLVDGIDGMMKFFQDYSFLKGKEADDVRAMLKFYDDIHPVVGNQSRPDVETKFNAAKRVPGLDDKVRELGEKLESQKLATTAAEEVAEYNRKCFYEALKAYEGDGGTST
ncbi:hypothetical protein HY642_04025 [Candidatus Woesearchaeota archaeon]|nr:hypothetical protein [Candidatus Woesearchaeota archaeon]